MLLARPGLAAAPDFTRAETALTRFLRENEVHAATFAVSRGGELLYDRAFGFADAALTQPLTPSARMRIASISKPMTAAAVRTLVREGKLRLDDPVVKYLPKPSFPPPRDPRWSRITIAQILDHKGGWDRGMAGDPMFQDRRIKEDLQEDTITPAIVVRWMLGRDLQFNPGERSAYSNFGYCLLGVVVEQITHQPYRDEMRRSVFNPAGMRTITLSSSRPEQRAAGEIWYDFGREGEHFLIEPMEAHGGWVCTAADLTRFLDHFWINGEPRSGGTGTWAFYGSLPGTTSVAVQRPDGLNYAILLNKRDPAGDWNGKLRALIDRALP